MIVAFTEEEYSIISAVLLLKVLEYERDDPKEVGGALEVLRSALCKLRTQHSQQKHTQAVVEQLMEETERIGGYGVDKE